MALRAATRSIFVFGFAKNDRDNIDQADERELKKLADLMLGLTEEDQDRLVAAGTPDEMNFDEAQSLKDVSQ